MNTTSRNSNYSDFTSTESKSSFVSSTSESMTDSSPYYTSTSIQPTTTTNVMYVLKDDAMAFLIGAFFAMVTLSVLVCFTVWYCKFRRSTSKTQMLISNEQPRHVKGVNNILYDNTTPRSEANLQNDDVTYKNTCAPHSYENRQSVLNKMDDIYVAKDEGEYDHLRAIRQKKVDVTVEEDGYGTADHWGEDFYSALGQNISAEPDLNNECNDMETYADTCNIFMP